MLFNFQRPCRVFFVFFLLFVFVFFLCGHGFEKDWNNRKQQKPWRFEFLPFSSTVWKSKVEFFSFFFLFFFKYITYISIFTHRNITLKLNARKFLNTLEGFSCLFNLLLSWFGVLYNCIKKEKNHKKKPARRQRVEAFGVWNHMKCNSINTITQ